MGLASRLTSDLLITLVWCMTWRSDELEGPEPSDKANCPVEGWSLLWLEVLRYRVCFPCPG